MCIISKKKQKKNKNSKQTNPHDVYDDDELTMNCFSGMVDGRKMFSLISSRNHCQRPSPSQLSDTPRAGFDPAWALLNEVVQ